MNDTVHIVNVDAEGYKAACELLSQNDLPVNDLNEATRLFALRENETIRGVVGIEKYGQHALLRSLCVDAAWRNKGLAQKLVQYVESVAKKEYIRGVYLLTTTADKWFAAQGYKTISRQEASEEITGSAQFQTTCPSSAILMYKEL